MNDVKELRKEARALSDALIRVEAKLDALLLVNGLRVPGDDPVMPVDDADLPPSIAFHRDAARARQEV